MNSFGSTLIDSVGGWPALFGLVALGMLIRGKDCKATMTNLSVAALSTSTIGLMGPLGAVLVVVLLSAMPQRLYTGPRRSNRLTPIVALSAAYGVGLAASVAVGMNEVRLFVLGTALFTSVGVVLETIWSLSSHAGNFVGHHSVTLAGSLSGRVPTWTRQRWTQQQRIP